MKLELEVVGIDWSTNLKNFHFESEMGVHVTEDIVVNMDF